MYFIILGIKRNGLEPLFISDDANYAQKTCDELNKKLFKFISSTELGYLQDECFCDCNYTFDEDIAECMHKLAKEKYKLNINPDLFLKYLQDDDMIIEYSFQQIDLKNENNT